MIANRLIKLSNLKAFKSFVKDSHNPMFHQEKYLMALIRSNESTDFGKLHDFSSLKGIKDFQKHVPILDYEDHQPYIQKHMDDRCQALVNETIDLFELSSGSTSASKYIPYTSGLQSDFMAGIKPWLYDLYHHYPKLMKGKAYWSVSPIASERTFTKSGIPVGFQDDTGYFDWVQKHLFNRLFIVPSDIKFISDIGDFRYITMFYLIREEKLSLISVWNPTFLENLLKTFLTYKNQIIEDINQGSIRPPNGSKLPKSMLKIKAKEKRAKTIESLLNDSETCVFHKIWPGLEIISCWDQGNSKGACDRLNQYFLDVTIQGKGLLATEGIASFPLHKIGCVVSYKSHFFEFMDLESDDIKLLDELEDGKSYKLIMTTRGGLYRYQLHDIVKVDGFYNQVPCIVFMGKSSNVSDFFGEKINEMHVKSILEEMKLDDSFSFLAPIEDETFYYTLFTNKSVSPQIFEAQLRKNFHYDYARNLGQLDRLRVFKLSGDYEKAYYDFLVKKKQMKLGDIKFQTLINITGIEQAFQGDYMKDDL
ncbi:GH3 auxin-responsive promoter family protein [Acidaminobacter sp. JC074]|uniref:GH3 auxin-responsive promoter family protein n=1 Tax=Acidaminobacter sp. JC074 TaxID=2530199 RepID=UPI001F103690|nr:GH3 auxin-responsive promoter family protein [Acidaminobacter sp. JC074]MCH4887811.1 GH3 auxin-responsive promoter family protein [Acidaminobacter sp. JC074]